MAVPTVYLSEIVCFRICVASYSYSGKTAPIGKFESVSFHFEMTEIACKALNSFNRFGEAFENSSTLNHLET